MSQSDEDLSGDGSQLDLDNIRYVHLLNSCLNFMYHQSNLCGYELLAMGKHGLG